MAGDTMRRLSTAALVAAILLTLSACAAAPIDYAARDRAARQAEQLANLDTALTAVWRVLPLLATLGALTYAAALAAAHVRRVWRERWPDQRGRLPVSAEHLDTLAPAALAAAHAAELLRAERSGAVPHTVTYAPRGSTSAAHAAAPDAETGARAPVAVPTMAQLIARGHIAPGAPLIFGTDLRSGDLVTGALGDLVSCAVAGLSGSGKTVTAAALLAQATLHGARLAIVDPHADSAESLSARLSALRPAMVAAPAAAAQDIAAMVRMVAAQLDRRQASGDTTPRRTLILAIDEYSALQRGGTVGAELAALVERIATEGRKYGVYVALSGQSWTAERSGGTPLRDNLAAVLLHRCRPAVAQMLTGLPRTELDTLDLAPGQALYLDRRGDMRHIAVPLTSADDMRHIAALLPRAATAAPGAVVTPVAAPVATPDAPLPPRADAVRLTTEQQHILDQFTSGKNIAEITRDLAGGVTGGRAYTTAAETVAQALRAALRDQK